MKINNVRVWLLLAAMALLMAPSHAESQMETDWALGSWNGTLIAGTMQLAILFNITRGDDGIPGGTMDVPTQGMVGLALSTVDIGDGKITLTFPVPGGGSYEGTRNEDGSGISGTFTQAGQAFPMKLEFSGAATTPPQRPQEPKPPFPYSVENVSITNAAADVVLAGTLTLPPGSGPFPGVVLVSGSGPQDRDETLLGHKPFWVLADYLTRQGIAVLRYDDRGVAESTGSFATATSEDFASDATAGVTFLAAHANVAADRVGIAGHSEGGIVGPMAASRSDAVAFVVMLAGPGVTGLEILVEQGRLINKAAGTPAEIVDLNARIQSSLAEIVSRVSDPTAAAPLLREAMRSEIDKLTPEIREMAGEGLGDAAIDQTVQQMNSPWFRFFLHYDPRPALEATRVPVLALIGGKDLQVPAEQNIPEITAAFERGGNSDATVRTLPGLNHLFQEAGTGSPAEYQQIEQTMSPIALEVVGNWIVERFGAHR